MSDLGKLLLFAVQEYELEKQGLWPAIPKAISAVKKGASIGSKLLRHVRGFTSPAAAIGTFSGKAVGALTKGGVMATGKRGMGLLFGGMMGHEAIKVARENAKRTGTQFAQRF